MPGVIIGGPIPLTPEDCTMQVDRIVRELLNTSSNLDSTGQLALTVAIRMTLDSPEVGTPELFQQTKLVAFVEAALRIVMQGDVRTNKEVDMQRRIEYCLGMELCWILVHLSCIDGSCVPGLFFSTVYTEQQTCYQQPTIYFEFVEKMLRNGDEAQKELVLWLLANCVADSPELGKILVEKLDFVDILFKLCD